MAEPTDAAVIATIRQIFDSAVAVGAQVVRLRPEFGMSVNLVGGVEQPGVEFEPDVFGHVSARIRLMSGMDFADPAIRQRGEIRVPIGGAYRDLKVSAERTPAGHRIAIAITDTPDEDLHQSGQMLS